jgi:tRNA (guanine26-N2/guanine27-N2)-dimethyltransferase
MSSTKITLPEIPEGFTLHTENNSHILLSSNEAFLNPVQEFNRDTSVACIRVWSEELHESKKARWLRAQEKKHTKQKKRKRERVDCKFLYCRIKSLCCSRCFARYV